MIKKIVFILLAGIFFNFQSLLALTINIYGPGDKKINLFIAKPFVAEQFRVDDKLVSTLKDKLGLLPFLRIIPAEDVLNKGEIKGPGLVDIDFRKFLLSRVDVLLTINLKPGSNWGEIELRAFDVLRQQLIVGKAYDLQSEAQLPLALRSFCGALLQQFTSRDSLFSEPIVFVHKQRQKQALYEIYADGYGLKKLLEVDGIIASPAWDFRGEKIVFTLIEHGRHFLGLWDKQSNKLEKHLLPGNSIISPIFTPEGEIVVSLDVKGNPDIYLLSKDFKIKKTLISHWAIDISPFFARNGEKMVFTSARLGNPHIFVWLKKENRIRRVSYEGKYNTSAVLSPDGRLVVFSRLLAEGHRIFVHDLESGQEKQISFGPGNDEEPFIASDGYFVLFSSNRSGKYKLYLTTINGDGPYLVDTQELNAYSPAWVHKLE